MSQLAMPLVVINLGIEMLYILEQRLKAQAIPDDKGSKVLLDVVRTMFDKTYVDKLFTPQELYDARSTRKIFDRLAHSSIMRLSESSMDKLFDLMMMGFKYQLLCSTKDDDVLKSTRLHLTTVRAMMVASKDGAVMGLLDNVEAQLTRVYGALSTGQMHQLRMTLLRFFQDKRVKVSLFLQEGIQSSVGRIILPSPITSTVGTVRYITPASVDALKLKVLSMDKNEFFCHPAPLGTNLYNKERAKVAPPARKGDPAVAGKPKVEEPDKATYAAEEVVHKGARKELDLLSALLAIKPATASDNFKLDLFGDNLAVGAAGAGGAAKAGPGVQTLEFGTGGKNDAYKAGGLAKVMKGLDVADKKGAADDDDLLSLMDGA